ncbi:M1 family aminopeptidase [Leifsonia sp. 21MFCrub1.1]|uniref:M1 family aminopeptidase n=1 Tax=Leifsonia sp. 21MFCrub1.1 TaxID=1798223 RepID=UPI000892A09F|nr:M1 family aminopeptidase [Leifsonia sp. 21MFCrub1.1]SEB11423.1 conserved repeat domain-containing protein [Leifsonia sp. 21MFCrub1.1]
MEPRNITPRRRLARPLAAVLAAALIGASQIALSTPAAAADGTPGATAIGDSLFRGIGNGGYDVKHYDVALAYNSDKTITATTLITATATQALSSFSLDFEGLTVSSVLVNGVAATFSRTSDPSISSYKLVVTPASTVTGDFTVAVAYSGTPVTHEDPDGSSEGWVSTSDGATALGQPVGTMTWLPSNNTPADKATYDITIDAPTTIDGVSAAAVSNGELVAKTPTGDGSRTSWHWRQTRPMATELAMITIGKYLVYESDIALAVSGRTIHEWTFVDPAVTTANQTTIQTRRAALPEILNYLESKYGAYPGGSTGFVVDITSLGYALETQDRPYFERSVSSGTFIHELAHQWFGDSVTPADWNSIWLNEGPATFIPTQYNQDHGSSTTTASSLFTTWNTTAASSSRWTIPSAAMTDPADLFDWQVYTRGAMTLEALRQSVGQTVFDNIMKTWVQRYAGQSKTTEDFIALAEELSGRDLGAFFQDWLYDADKPAWPSTWTLGLTSDPAGGQVVPGQVITYTLTANNTGQIGLTGATATVDLADVVDDAAIDTSSLPAGLTRNGTTLTWTVPDTATSGSATVAFTAVVAKTSSGGTLTATATVEALGAACAACSSTLTTPVIPTPDPITEADLTDATRGPVRVPTTAVPGGVVHVTIVGGAHEGETVTPVLFSTPRPLAAAVVSGGAVSVTIPADAALGAHKLAIVDAQGGLIGWGALTLVAAAGSPDPQGGPAATGSGALASTGSSVTLPLGIASGVLLAGVAALLLAVWRRRRATRIAIEGPSQD